MVEHFEKISKTECVKRLNGLRSFHVFVGEILETKDVAVLIDAEHLCVSSIGVEDVNSSTVSSFYGGKFKADATKNEFLKYLRL